jgi:dienelactone hydrolase
MDVNPSVDRRTNQRFYRPMQWIAQQALGLGLALIGAALPVQSLAPPPILTPDLANFPRVQPYDIGVITITQPGVAAPFHTMPIPLTGAIAVPDGPGPFPWVVLLHGRHPGCHFADGGDSQWPCPPGSETRYDWGLAYLAQGLAEAGYGVLVPNLNGAFTDTYGATAANRSALADQRSGQIIDAHLSRLGAAHRGDTGDFGISLVGQVDRSKLAIVGHSMGGGAAALVALTQQDAMSSWVAAGLGPPSALVLVAPTRSQPVAEYPDVFRLPDIPTAVLMGGCDRDIFDFSSLYYLETARQDPRRTTPALGVLLWGANHNFFNAAVAPDDYYRQPNQGDLCDPQRSPHRLSRVIQEATLRQYVTDFLQVVWSEPADRPPLASLGLAPDRPAPAHYQGLAITTTLVLPATHRFTLFNAEDSLPDYLPQSTPGLTLRLCPSFAPCGDRPRPYPQFPSALALDWATPVERLHFPLPTTDVSAFDSLELRLAAEHSSTTSGVTLGLILQDQRGRAVRVDIPPTAPALRQMPQAVSPGQSATPTYPTALRVPLGQFRGVDLSALDSLTLVLGENSPGRLYLSSIEFVRR